MSSTVPYQGLFVAAPAVAGGCRPRRAASVWRVAGLVVAGLLSAAADAPRTTQEAQAHAQAAVAEQMRDMGVDDSVFYGLHTVELPRTYGPPGLAVCGTTVDADPRFQPWAMHFIAFFEREDAAWPWTMDDLMFERSLESDTTTAADLCQAMLDPARSRAVPDAMAAGPRP